MNGAHNYCKITKIYVLRCTTIGLKQECGHKTSRGAVMNLRFKPHFTAKIGHFFVPTSQKMRLCVDVIWRHSCSYVVLPINEYIQIHSEMVIPKYIELSASYFQRSPTVFTGWAIIDMIEELAIRRQSAYFWSVGGRNRVIYIVMLIHRHDMRSGLQ